MTTLDAFSDFNTPSPVRGVSDVVAYTIHNLGFWPTRSVVLVATGARHMGPVLRVNLEDISENEASALLDYLFDMMPTSLAEGEQVDRFFLLIFGEGGEVRTRQLTASLRQTPTLEEIQKDAAEAKICQAWIRAGMHITDTRGILFCDLLFIGSVSRWEMEPAEPAMVFSGFIDDIQKCPLYLDLMLKGSSVLPTEEQAVQAQSSPLNATNNQAEYQAWLDDAEYWFAHYLQVIHGADSDYCQDYLGQKYAENLLWDAAIQTISRTRRERFSAEERLHEDALYADHLREILAPQLAGYLLATLSSVTSGQFILYAAATSTNLLTQLFADLHREQTHLTASAENIQNPSVLLVPVDHTGQPFIDDCIRKLADIKNFAEVVEQNDELSSGAEDFAEMMMGNSILGPDWKNIGLLEQVILQMQEIADDERSAYLAVVQAWIAWFKGSSSTASRHLAQARQTWEISLLPLDALLENSLLPRWLQEESQCFKESKWT